MKKTLLLFASFGIVSLAFPQTEEGKIVIGAASNLSYTSTVSNSDDEKTNTFNVGSSVGYFFMDDLSAGLSLTYANVSTGGASISALGIGPFLRFYFDGALFLEGGYILQSQNTDFAFSDSKANGGQVFLGTGYAIFLNDNIAFEPSIEYSAGTGDFDGTKNLGVKFGFSLYL